MYADYLVHFNKNHDKKTGRFTFGDGNGDGVSPDDYRTPELDKKYSELEKTGIFKLYDNKPWLKPEDNAEEKWGKDVVKAVDIGIKAFGAEKMWGSENIDKNSLRSWFLLEDQAIGFPEIAYLLVKGWSGDKVFNALRDADKMWEKDNSFLDAYTGYPNNKNWNKLFNEATNKEPYKDIYTLMEVSHYITDESDTIDTYITECEELLKEMEHSNMDYSSYLIHFNTRHDPKTGRFDFALPGERKQNYGGQKRSDYVKSMSSRYQEEGYSKGKSRRLAGYAAKSNKVSTQQYNNNIRQYQKMQKKALTDYDKHDEIKYNKHVNKLIEAYKWAKINDELISKDYEMGKALYEPLIVKIANDFTFGGAIPGTIKAVADFNSRTPNKWTKSDSQGTLLAEARRKVTNDMTNDYITKHPKEALDQAIAISKLEKFLYGEM